MAEPEPRGLGPDAQPWCEETDTAPADLLRELRQILSERIPDGLLWKLWHEGARIAKTLELSHGRWASSRPSSPISATAPPENRAGTPRARAPPGDQPAQAAHALHRTGIGKLAWTSNSKCTAG